MIRQLARCLLFAPWGLAPLGLALPHPAPSGEASGPDDHPPASRAAVVVTNPSPLARRAETVEVSWSDLGRVLPQLVHPPEEAAYLAVYQDTTELPGQVWLDPDDPARKSLLFQADFSPGEKKVFQVRLVPARTLFASPVDARFVLPREDVAWESDRIAFRIYGSVLAGDVNNGIDVWTKSVRSPIVEKWYKADEGRIGGKDYYHKDRGEGADYFSVGKSLGAGGCALWRNGTLYQPGLFTTERVLATGPIRAAFRVTYEKGTLDGQPYHEQMTVWIDKGSNLNRIEVMYTGLPPAESLACYIGLVRRKGVGEQAGAAPARWVGLWGPTTDDPAAGSLGTGIVLAAPAAGRQLDDAAHAGLLVAARQGVPIVYYAGAGWTGSGDFRNAGDWSGCLETRAALTVAPLHVTVAP